MSLDSPSQSDASEVISIKSKQRVPGSFGRRLVATIIDGLVIAIACVPVTIGATMVFGSFGGSSSKILGPSIVANLIQITAMTFYYGMFYQSKGASPGKAMLNLVVVHSETGENLDFKQSFLREVIGKFFINTFTIGIGYIIAAFREDGKALHDIMFSSQVWYEPKE